MKYVNYMKASDLKGIFDKSKKDKSMQGPQSMQNQQSPQGGSRKVVTADEAAAKARKSIIAVLAAGALLIATDMVLSSQGQSAGIVESGGSIYIVRPAEDQDPDHLVLRAKVSDGDKVIEKKIDLTMDPYEKESSEEKQNEGDGEAAGKRNREAVEMELRGIASELNSDKAVKKVKLPDSLASGEKISWEVEDKSGSNGIAIMAVTVLTAFCIYKKRFSVLEQQRRLQRESVMRQLPEFVNRLVLLLNAGLVLTSAFEKSVEESFVEDSKGDDYFYGKLREIYVLCTTTNASMHVEFRKMAKESGIRELMRVSNIISDNIRKGVELTGKLQAESELLWISRKKSCEEKGRLAETKLTLPLMIFLMVLIIITVAPALMEL